MLKKRCEIDEDDLNKVIDEYGKTKITWNSYKTEQSTYIYAKLIDLTNLRERNVEDLSGGELQRFACAVSCIRKSDM